MGRGSRYVVGFQQQISSLNPMTRSRLNFGDLTILHYNWESVFIELHLIHSFLFSPSIDLSTITNTLLPLYIATMPSYTSLIILPILASSASAFTAPVVVGNCRVSSSTTCSILPKTSSSKLQMAIDYNDPVVMEEFNAIQSMEYDDVVEELSQSGVRAPADMGDMVCCFVCVSFCNTT